MPSCNHSQSHAQTAMTFYWPVATKDRSTVVSHDVQCPPLKTYTLLLTTIGPSIVENLPGINLLQTQPGQKSLEKLSLGY